MAIEYKKSLAVFDDFVGVEDAEALLEWFQKNPKGKVNFTTCTHIHASNLQVLMAVKPPVVAWSKDEDLQLWLEPLLR
ncbi:MAG: hypothetical protein PHN45_06550 [Methylococcales bacterium]|nr:hypothetical protein [Methylococcales bacterium]MDD5754395.1 hypothetical protein [Methylococcales bacterium]